MTGDLNEQQINNILTSQIFGRVACCSNAHPYIVPVTYTFDGKRIYVQSYEGTKLDLMRANPNVCLQVDIINDLYNWQSVQVYGQFKELSGEESAKARTTLFSSVLPLMTGSSIHAHEHEEGPGHELSDPSMVKPIMFAIVIHQKTGRFENRCN
jgi:uncharacterized protein